MRHHKISPLGAFTKLDTL